MVYYYVALQSKSHAFLLERRMSLLGIECQLVYMPREIMRDLCSMGVRFEEHNYESAVQAIRNSGLPGCRLFKELKYPAYSKYSEVQF